MKKRTVAVLCAVAAVLGVIIGGTMAYLQHGASVVNTFTAGTIRMGLTETEREYIMVPGTTLDKDPKVSVAQDSESCYLFVKVDELQNTNPEAITWKPTAGWTKLEGVDGTVYYHEYNKGAQDQYAEAGTMGVDGEQVAAWVYSFLEDDQVTVSDSLTKNDMTNYGKDTAKYPKLNFTAYAIQKQYLTDNGTDATPEEAWALVQQDGVASGT